MFISYQCGHFLLGPRLNLLAALGDGQRGSKRINRAGLRAALSHGLEDSIQWGTVAKSYAVDKDGSITVTVEKSGSTSTLCVDLLVVADGAHSKLRLQRAPRLRQLEDVKVSNLAFI